MKSVSVKVAELEQVATRLSKVDKWLDCIGHGTVNYGLQIHGPDFGITLDKNVTEEIEALVKHILEDERMNLRARLRQHNLLDEPDDNSVERVVSSAPYDADRLAAIRVRMETNNGVHD